MTVGEFKDSEFGQTMMFIEERQKVMIDQRDVKEQDYMIGRLNTFYIMKSFGAKLDKPEELYQLNNDKEKPTKAVDPFSDEANAVFNKMDSVTDWKSVSNRNLVKELKIQK